MTHCSVGRTTPWALLRDNAGVGVAAWSPRLKSSRGLTGYVKVPTAVRALWDFQYANTNQFYDIMEIEAIGPAVLLHNWEWLFRHSLWIHFIDNDSSMFSLIKGSSSVLAADTIVGFTWQRICDLRALAWFDRVDSLSNPVDGLSRGRLDGP